MEAYKMNYTVTLPSYSVGTDCYKEIPWVTRHFGKKAVVVGGKTAMEKAKPELLKALEGTDVEILDFIWYGGNSTYENTEALKNNPTVQAADMVFGVGGGRAVDTCKVFCDQLDKPLFTFPTIASNCAASSSLAIVYNEDGSFCDFVHFLQSAKHVFLDTEIVANAPVRFLWAGIGEAPEKLLWAGIGDALSKECEVLLATRGKELFHTPLMGAQLSRACTTPLVECGKKALEDCRNGVASYELQQVALDIIVSTGLVSNMTSGGDAYYYNSSLAHCVYYGATMIHRAASHLHGEIVSFGVLCLLTYDGQLEERDRLMQFNKSVGLPICLADMDLKPEDLPVMVKKASSVLEWTCVPYTMDGDRFIKAILDCDACGQKLK